MPKREGQKWSLHSWLPIHKPVQSSLPPTAHMAQSTLHGSGSSALIPRQSKVPEVPFGSVPAQAEVTKMPLSLAHGLGRGRQRTSEAF